MQSNSIPVDLKCCWEYSEVVWLYIIIFVQHLSMSNRQIRFLKISRLMVSTKWRGTKPRINQMIILLIRNSTASYKTNSFSGTSGKKISKHSSSWFQYLCDSLNELRVQSKWQIIKKNHRKMSSIMLITFPYLLNEGSSIKTWGLHARLANRAVQLPRTTLIKLNKQPHVPAHLWPAVQPILLSVKAFFHKCVD